jgi:hypothetical protein
MRTSARPRAGTRGSPLLVRSSRFTALSCPRGPGVPALPGLVRQDGKEGSTVRVRQKLRGKACKSCGLACPDRKHLSRAGTRGLLLMFARHASPARTNHASKRKALSASPASAPAGDGDGNYATVAGIDFLASVLACSTLPLSTSCFETLFAFDSRHAHTLPGAAGAVATHALVTRPHLGL